MAGPSSFSTFLLGGLLGIAAGFGTALYLNERQQLPRFPLLAPKVPYDTSLPSRVLPGAFKPGWYLFSYKSGGGRPKQIERLASQELALTTFNHAISQDDGYVHKLAEVRTEVEFNRINNATMTRSEYENLLRAQTRAKAA